MTKSQDKDINKMRLFVANLMNHEQDVYSKLVAHLRLIAGNTKECKDMIEVLTTIYESKIEVLDKVYKEMQGV